MKSSIFRAVFTAVALFLATSLSFAADAKADKKTPVKAEAAKPADKKADAKPADEKAAKSNLVDINTATDAELKAIPGLGDAYVAKIVVGRPYAKKDQLKSRNIVPAAVYDKIKDKIIAKQAKKEDKAVAKPETKKK
jgi:DNA uptake protein ComE-like DNA-binding protein